MKPDYIRESFQWFVKDYRVNPARGKNRVNIKGRALFAGAISKNMRKYDVKKLKGQHAPSSVNPSRLTIKDEAS